MFVCLHGSTALKRLAYSSRVKRLWRLWLWPIALAALCHGVHVIPDILQTPAPIKRDWISIKSSGCRSRRSRHTTEENSSTVAWLRQEGRDAYLKSKSDATAA